MPWALAHNSQTINVTSVDGSRIRATVTAAGYDLSFEAGFLTGEVLKRFVGCAFVSFMPPDGLDDALETLADYYEFHAPKFAELAESVTEPREYHGKMVGAAVPAR